MAYAHDQPVVSGSRLADRANNHSAKQAVRLLQDDGVGDQHSACTAASQLDGRRRRPPDKRLPAAVLGQVCQTVGRKCRLGDSATSASMPRL